MSWDLVNGGTIVAAAVVALFFFRYWRLTRDRLFAMFAAGFLTFAGSRVILAFLDEGDEGTVFVYAFRLLAFALILAAIIDKNRSPGPVGGASRNGSGPHRDVKQRTSAPHSP
jgi:hypothetical protein